MIDTPESELRDTPFALVRVLEPWKLRLSPDVLIKGPRAMLLTQNFNGRFFRTHRKGRTSFYMNSTGEEAIDPAQSTVRERDDMCVPTYRVLNWLMARRYPVVDLLNQIFSNARDYGFYSLR